MEDPDIQAAREICASTYEAQTDFLDEQHRRDWAGHMRNGAYDDERVFLTALAGIKHGRDNPEDPLPSIANSLKRLADEVIGTDTRTGIALTLHYIERRLGRQS